MSSRSHNYSIATGRRTFFIPEKCIVIERARSTEGMFTINNQGAGVLTWPYRLIRNSYVSLESDCTKIKDVSICQCNII